MHTLIVGSSDTPRAAFLDSLLSELNVPKLYGYRSVKEEADETGRAPIYIYPAGGARIRGQDNLLGWCKARQSTALPEAFERNANLIESAAPGGLLVMDEIGPMESRSPRFCAAVLNALNGGVPVLATVRDIDQPFLRQVRSHPNARCFLLTRSNGEALRSEVLAFLREQLK